MNEATKYAETFYSETQNDIDFLEKTIHDFPASSVARFLLLYHYKKNKLEGFESLAQQTGIYLNNPSWIQYQLSKIGENEVEVERLQEENDQQENKAVAVSEEEKLPEPPEEDLISFNENKEELITAPENGVEEKVLPAAEILKEIPERLENEDKDAEVKTSGSHNSEINLHNKPADEIEIPVEQPEETSNKIDEIPDENKIVNEEIPERLENEDEASESNKSESEKFDIQEKISADEIKIPELKVEMPDENAGQSARNEKSVNDIQIPTNEEEILNKEKPLNPYNTQEEEEETISFEPLHTVDYFASQGIKINEEALANDHLVKQVKSFTAWLKSMKKLHPGQLPEQNEVIEKIIQTSSEASNKDAHVLTEAMAEVLVKQGKREKAIEMYEKLSLINPSKSAYFAAKIESLKII